MEPITRKEMYLAKISGDYSGAVPKPVTRMDYYMAKAAGTYSGPLPRPIVQQEFYWAYICGNTNIRLPDPVTRVDMYLGAICGGTVLLPEPITREKIYLSKIAKYSEAVIKTATGKTIVLTDSMDAPFEDFKVYGHTTQDGIPTPENPVELVNAGDKGNIEISVTDGADNIQTLTMLTPNGLPGIFRWYYTDENGQQWIANFRDWERGVDVQMVGETDLTGATWVRNEAYKYYTRVDENKYKSETLILCTKSLSIDLGRSDNTMFINNLGTIRINWVNEVDTVEYVAEKMNGAILYGILATPIESPIPAEELAAYRALHTNTPTTTIVNDEDCWMEVRYRAKPISMYRMT